MIKNILVTEKFHIQLSITNLVLDCTLFDLNQIVNNLIYLKYYFWYVFRFLETLSKLWKNLESMQTVRSWRNARQRRLALAVDILCIRQRFNIFD